MKRFLNIYFLAFILILSACDDFLSERPTKSSSIVPSTVADMETILVGMWRSDNVSPYHIYGGGDIELNAELERRIPGSYPIYFVQAGTWEREVSGTNKDYMWMYRYQNIFRSNMVFYYIDNINATEEQRQYIKSKASFRRAYSYMELLNIYTLPYNQANLSEPGLVLTDKIGFDYSLERASLKDTYDFVEKDIKEALKITVDLNAKFGQGSSYRVTNASANALAARFYLMKHDYTNAKKHAQAALDKYGVSNIMDYNQIGYSSRVDNGSITIDGQVKSFQVKYPNTQFNYDLTNQWTEDYFISSTMTGFSASSLIDIIPSKSLIASFETDGGSAFDARWKFFYVKNYFYLNNKPIDVPAYLKPRNYSITVPEMLLTVAECEARAGDFNKAIQLVNQLRAKRIDPAGTVNLTAANKDEAIAIVIRERRRETGPFNRLFDIRRYNSNDYAADDIIVEQEFYSYSPLSVDLSSTVKKYQLKPGERKYAAPIPADDILAGNGEIKQNTY